MKNNKTHIILLYLIILVLIGVNIISNKNIILENNKIILKNMDESTQIANKEKTIDDLNASKTEYSNYINTSKTNLAKAITNAGVTTNGTDSFETMIANVSNILSNKTNDATATAASILSGKTAYVRGSKVTGTMKDKGSLNWKPTSSTTYNVTAGYYSGGTLDSSSAYNAGITYADGRVNTSSESYKNGYNDGLGSNMKKVQLYFEKIDDYSVQTTVDLSYIPKNMLLVGQSPLGYYSGLKYYYINFENEPELSIYFYAADNANFAVVTVTREIVNNKLVLTISSTPLGYYRLYGTYNLYYSYN